MTYDEWAEENLNFTVSLAFPDQGKILLDKYRKCWQDAQAALRSPAARQAETGAVGEVVKAARILANECRDDYNVHHGCYMAESVMFNDLVEAVDALAALASGAVVEG